MALSNFLLLLVISSVMFGIATASTDETTTQLIKPGQNLQARLYGEGTGNCWNALLELKSCTNEIVIFFLNGESYLGYDCCRAIRIITRECWPTMLTSIGFTSQEGDILRGYCDATTGSPTAPPAQAPVYESKA
ncbi:hypothetical protein ACHQM5_029374 [Ranunculus cassubicifolius]